ncbi:winged helix-turn-helix transcriptional regulator [Streptomyces sp. NPDC050516]|uniref:winged helix-turn-helix transcriptional regulator n=1 Tax=Streptomyces sp. NPDC050516 TaxID=3365621 RepID=UPI0037B0A819
MLCRDRRGTDSGAARGVVEYSLTEIGISLRGLVGQLEEWGNYYREQVRSTVADVPDSSAA